MSLNRVLNRPMFRREALRRGALKPIKAKVGKYMEGPLQMQTVNQVPPSQYSRVYFPEKVGGKTVPYSKFPAPFMKYDPVRGSYITEAGKFRMGRGLTGLTGLAALYKGAEMAGIPDPILNTIGAAELASLPLALGKSATSKNLSRILGSGTRFASTNPIGALTIGAGLALTGGAKSYYDETKMVKDYAKANNIPFKKAFDIFNRDLSFGGQRPMVSSDLAKLVLAGSPGTRNLVTRGLDKTPEGPPGSMSKEQRIAGEMRQYMKDSKQFGRYYQDVDELVKKVKDKENKLLMAEETASMSPDDAGQFESVGGQIALEKNIAIAELRNALMAQKNLDVNKATNLALAITEGDIESNNVDAIVKSDELYAQVPNRVGDQNHPKFVKEVKTVEEIDKKSKTPENAGGDGVSTENAGGTSIGTKQDLTGDPEIDEAKKAAESIDMTQFLKADPRKTEMDPQRVFLMKLAAGLLSGKTMKGGFAGLADVFGQALGPAVDAKILVKMKNDEAYRDWASTVLSYNTDLLKLRNDALKDALDAAGNSKFELGSFEQGGQFFEAKKDKNTGEVYVYDGKDYKLASPDQGQFYVQKDNAAYMDNIRLIADGQLSEDILRQQITLMSTDAGKKAIGGSGIILGFANVLKNIPPEIAAGLSGSISTDFNMSQGDLSDKEFEKLQQRTDKVLEKFEDKTAKFMASDPNASEILGKLKVNARTLTYTLANALKDKDRLTNRDLDLIEELTGFLGLEPDDKIIQKYEELLGIVQEKNRLRKNRFYTMGYTSSDINGILNSFGTGQVIAETNPNAFTTDLDALDFLMGNQ
jgi:hypothetical protein